MKAAVLRSPRKNSKHPLQIEDLPLSRNLRQDKSLFACGRVACAGLTCILWKASFRSVANL